jgi:CBS domain containing-hemolysin-like protein
MQLGHIPRGGESILYEGRKMTVTEMDGRRIKQVRVEPVEESQTVQSLD